MRENEAGKTARAHCPIVPGSTEPMSDSLLPNKRQIHLPWGRKLGLGGGFWHQLL